jgi:hypothetical protein
MFGYRHTSARSSGTLQSLAHYREQEQLLLKQSSAAVTDDGALLEYEALELRIHPPNVRSAGVQCVMTGAPQPCRCCGCMVTHTCKPSPR